ncbi:hypothetical protein [Streptomyces sp. NPDC048636]|uniref:hypothetical protein n=1 Tax=Streptomyces sp. NPDC048636 TaxID=3155762 RepID=UPI00341B16A7
MRDPHNTDTAQTPDTAPGADSRQTLSPVSDSPDLFEFTGDITDYWSYSQIRDYVLLMPGLSHTTLRLYLLLRSMVTEANRWPRGGLRRMTIDQMCWLLPGPGGKPISVSAMYELLDALKKLNLVVPKDSIAAEGASALKGKEKAARGILRGYTVKDLPPTEYTGWRNAWDKLDAYTPNWRTDQPQPPTHLTDLRQDEDGRMTAQVRQVGPGGEMFQKSGTPQAADSAPCAFQNPGTPSQDSGTPFRKTGTDLSLTCENQPLQRSLSKKPSSPSRTGTPQADLAAPQAGGGESAKGRSAPEPATTARPDDHDSTHNGERIADAWIASRQAHGHGIPSRARSRLTRDANLLLAQGEDVEYLVAAVTDMGKRANWFDLTRHLESFVIPAKVTLPGRRRPLPDWCGICNDGNPPAQPGQRLRESAEGTLTKCPSCHPGATPTTLPASTEPRANGGKPKNRPATPYLDLDHGIADHR